MEKMLTTLKITLSMIASYLFGDFDLLMQLLCLVMAVDFISGLILATVFHKSPKTVSGAVASKPAVKGLIRKVCQLLLVAVISRLSLAVGDDSFCRNTAILFFVAGESISILENMGLMGIQYPAWLKNALDLLKKK
ncbi:MAG: phage holin family protein [Clostridia bacterium]|nr:phage holin family protein [Clostridia bacterium]